MSYMYSGYGNSGYEYDRNDRYYDRGGYQDRHKEYPMYPTKKDLVQTYPNRIDHDRPRWSWCLTILSMIVATMCCPLFGLVGYGYVSHAYTDHKVNDHFFARYKRRCAWGWTITGLVLGILGWITLIVIYSLIFSNQWAALIVG